MPSDLDRQIDATMAVLTAPSGPLPVESLDVGGRSFPVFSGAPPSLPAFFAYFCHVHADKDFIVAGEERLTFGQAYQHAMTVARLLMAHHHVTKGTVVGIAMRNSPAWIILYMGVLMAGGVAALLNGFWEGDELAEAVDMVGAPLVLADDKRAQRLQQAGRPTTAMVLVCDVVAPMDAVVAALGSPVAPDLNEVALPAVTGDDLATILFTSGSTGRSKGAFSNHRNVVQATFNYLASSAMVNAIRTAAGTASTRQPATVLSLPLFHVTGEVALLLLSFAQGRKMVLMPKWDVVEAMRLIEGERITYFVGVPLMSIEIANHPDRDRFDLSSCADYASGGAPRPVDHVRRLGEMPHGKPLIGYGLTETNAVGCGNFGTGYLAKPDSTGRACLPLVDLAILDDAGKPMPAGERGEVCIRSIANFLGYWNDTTATAAAMTADGYFRTGDIGYLDADGYLFIVDRKKDIIIRGGENITCPEVEAALYSHQSVRECAVFGVPDTRYGEVPVAVVYLDLGAEPVDAAGLQAHLAGHIATFKIPPVIWFAPAPLPKLGTEKIDKVTLRKHYTGAGAADTVRLT